MTIRLQSTIMAAAGTLYRSGEKLQALELIKQAMFEYKNSLMFLGNYAIYLNDLIEYQRYIHLHDDKDRNKELMMYHVETLMKYYISMVYNCDCTEMTDNIRDIDYDDFINILRIDDIFASQCEEYRNSQRGLTTQMRIDIYGQLSQINESQCDEINNVEF